MLSLRRNVMLHRSFWGSIWILLDTRLDPIMWHNALTRRNVMLHSSFWGSIWIILDTRLDPKVMLHNALTTGVLKKKTPPLRVQNRRSLEGFLFFWDFELRKKLGGFYFSEIFGILAWVLLVNLSTFLAWFYYQIWPKKPKIFRRFAPNRVGVFIFIENLQNFGRGF